MCSNGIEGIDASGVVCCPASCGACAGNDCASRPGGSSQCCGSGIKASAVYCSESKTAPCIIDGGAVWLFFRHSIIVHFAPQRSALRCGCRAALGVRGWSYYICWTLPPARLCNSPDIFPHPSPRVRALLALGHTAVSTAQTRQTPGRRRPRPRRPRPRPPRPRPPRPRLPRSRPPPSPRPPPRPLR